MASVKDPVSEGNILGIRISTARKAAGLTQKSLGDQVHVKPSTIAGYESGLADPKSDGLILISRACRCTVDYLLGLSDDPSPEDEKSAPAAEAAGAQINIDSLYDSLIERGYIQPGTDLSEEDMNFLISLDSVARLWFKRK